MIDVLVTGGAGFIGSNFVRHALEAHADWRITTVDKLTYAGRLETLHDIIDHPRHHFVRADVCDERAVVPLVKRSAIVVHFAAETHVDRSLMSAETFIQTDVVGTYVMLEAARRADALRRFVHISTDEVYGSVERGSSREGDELRPRNPYAASKAGADRLAYSYFASFGVPVLIARPSNNYGPYQFPEKVIPLFVTNAIDGRGLPLYGDGRHMRDWLHVRDHCRALDLRRVRCTTSAGATRSPTSISPTASSSCSADRRRWSSASLIESDTTGATASTPRRCGRSGGRRPFPSMRGSARPSSGTGGTSGGGVR
jgi:dTDP-glucose 4,6-dehydratase